MVHSTVLDVFSDQYSICCSVRSDHPALMHMRYDFVHLLQLKCSAAKEAADGDANGTHDGDADSYPGGHADGHADGYADGHPGGHADEHADGHAGGHADAGAGEVVKLTTMPVHMSMGGVMGRGRFKVNGSSTTLHTRPPLPHTSTARPCVRSMSSTSTASSLRTASAVAKGVSRSSSSIFWHFVEEIMQNIIRDRWGMAHIDVSEARMPRLLQGYVICDVCFADDEWDKVTNRRR